LSALSFTFKDRRSLTAALALAIVKSVQRLPSFTLTVSGLSGGNAIRALRDVLDRPGDPEAESRLCAALALCRSLKSTESATHFELTLNPRV
jgi:hypothetical protein